MKVMKITRSEFEKFKALQKREHPHCHASFSTNCNEDTWPFVTSGLTPLELRTEVRKLSYLLDDVVGEFLRVRTGGGRFFIEKEGVYWKDKSRHPFITWKPDAALANFWREEEIRRAASLEAAHTAFLKQCRPSSMQVTERNYPEGQ